MNQQTSYSHKESILECKKIKHDLNSEESVLPMKSIQNSPNVAELTKIMLGTISKENARKMNLYERHVFYNITDGIFALTSNLN